MTAKFAFMPTTGKTTAASPTNSLIVTKCALIGRRTHLLPLSQTAARYNTNAASPTDGKSRNTIPVSLNRSNANMA